MHIPHHGAHTRQARYEIDLGNGIRHRVLPQRIRAHKWVSLGAFPFAGTPKVRLTNITTDAQNLKDSKNAEDVAWDAIAIAKLPGKPANIVAAMGDSYASGEGASVTAGGDYYRETDVDGKGNGHWRDACHRSTKSWSRVMRFAGFATGVGARADSLDPAVDYRMVACSGARIRNLLASDTGARDAWGNAAGPSYSEVAQLDSGWVDQDTTLVTLSAGGNDARFASIVAHCIIPGLYLCQNEILSGDPEALATYEPKVINEKVRPSMDTLINEIHRKAPNAKILLMGYPLLLPDNDWCVTGIEPAEARWLNSTGAELNNALKAVVASAKGRGIPIEFGDPVGDFQGKGVCGNPELIHGIVTALTPGDDPAFEYWPGHGFVSGQGFHPKIEGAAKYAETADRTLRLLGL